MDIKDYASILIPKVWLLVLGALLAALACYFVATTYAQWPTYEAHGTLLIQEKKAGDTIQDPQKLGIYQRTLSVLATRPPLTQNVVDSLGLDMPEDELAALIRIQAPDDTPIIEVIAIHKDAETAATIANAMMQELHTNTDSNINTSILAPVEVPKGPQAASYLLLLIAAAIGGSIAIGGVLLAEYFNDVIRHEQDVAQGLDMPLLGQIDQVSNASDQIMASAQNAYHWLFAQIYVENGRMPNSMLITSPQACVQQSEFVSMFIQCNLRHNAQKQLIHNFAPSLNNSLLPNHFDQTQSESEQLEIDSTDHQELLTGPIYNLNVIEKQLDAEHPEAERKQSQIVDGPPVLSNVNTVMMAKRFESVLMVLHANDTKLSETKQAQQLLNQAGANVIGAVLLT